MYHMCGENDSIVSTPGPTEDPPRCPLPRSSAAEPLELLAPTSAVLMLMLCSSSTWLCAYGVGQCVRGSLIGNHHRRAVVSYVAPISYRSLTVRVPIMIPVPVWYTRYWYMTITREQIADPADGTDPTHVNMCERSRSYRSHPGKY